MIVCAAVLLFLVPSIVMGLDLVIEPIGPRGASRFDGSVVWGLLLRSKRGLGKCGSGRKGVVERAAREVAGLDD